MKTLNIKALAAASALALSASFVGAGSASASPAAPAPVVKSALPVVSGAKSLSTQEKAGVAGKGLITVNALNGADLNLLNNLNILNIGSFNKWINNGGSGCGCGIGPS